MSLEDPCAGRSLRAAQGPWRSCRDMKELTRREGERISAHFYRILNTKSSVKAELSF